MKQVLIVLPALLSCSIRLIGQSSTITGVVQDSNLRRIAGAMVRYTILPDPKQSPTVRHRPPPPAVNSFTVTDGQGNFHVNELPPGRYYICAMAAGSGHLSSCSYAPRPVVIAVGQGAATSPVVLTNPVGTVIRIHVVDVSAVIGRGARFRISSLATGGTSESARFVGQQGQERLYELTIPRDRASRLMIDTDRAVTDASGLPLALRQPSVALPVASTSFDLRVSVN